MMRCVRFHHSSPPVRERIANRSFPSIVQAWDDVVGLDHLTWEQRNVLHDLHFSTLFDWALAWDTTETEPNPGVATRMAGDIEYAIEVRQRKLDQNPNMVFLLQSSYPRTYSRLKPFRIKF